MLEKILLILRNIFRVHSNAHEDINPDDFYHSSRTAEGWELVDDVSDPGAPTSTSDRPPGVKSSLPPYPVVWTYFTANGYPDAEARRFYQCYQLMGWNERIIPTLTNWPELADHWMHQSPRHHNTKPPPDDTDTGSDNHHPGPV